MKQIAASIGKSFQTIYREIERNSKPDGDYQPWWAHNQALLRRARPKEQKLRSSKPLRALVLGRLQAKIGRSCSVGLDLAIFFDLPPLA